MSSDAQDPADRRPPPHEPTDGEPPEGTPAGGSPPEPPPTEPSQAEPSRVEPAGAAAPTRPTGPGRLARASRWTAGVVVLLLAAVLGGVAVIATYARNEVLDTNSYVATVAPLGSNPTIQAAIANRLSTEIVTQTDIAGTANDLANRLIQQGARERIKDLVPPLVGGIQSFLNETIRKLLATPEFAQLWNEVNRRAHASLVAVLTGTKHGAVSASSDTVTIDLNVFLQQVKQRLLARGLTFAERIPNRPIPYEVVQSDKLPKIQSYVRAFNTLALWLPWVAVALFLGGFLITPNRRRGIITGIVMLGSIDILLLALFAILRSYYIDNLPPTVQSPQAATDVYDTVLRYLNTALQALLVAVIIILVAALYAGPSRPARWLRHQIGRPLDAAGNALGRTGARARAVGNAVMTIRWPLEVALAVIGIVILLVTTRPSPAAVGWLTLALVGILVIVEILARMAGAPAPSTHADGEPNGGVHNGPRGQPTGQQA